eukprot:gene21462-12231_t
MARYVLAASGHGAARSALFVTVGRHGGPYESDYGRDFMFHGCRRLLAVAVDWLARASLHVTDRQR